MAEKRILVCQECGKNFVQKTHEIFCSRFCYLSHTRRRKVTSVCKGCGKSFEHEAYRERAFCSSECMNQHYQAKRRVNTKTPILKASPRTTAMNKFRIEMGLQPYEEGILNCKLCSTPFKSWDIRRNKHCPACVAQFNRSYTDAA